MDINQFLTRVMDEKFVARAATNLNRPHSEIKAILVTYANEARVGYSLIQPFLDPNKRILEVGAGIGVLSSYLHMNGQSIVAIEPSGVGFDLNNALGRELHQWLELESIEYLDIGVETLARDKLGEFEVIYSVNVVEHLPDLELAFDRMNSVLSRTGTMLHTCPNYNVPYEPHFGIPLIPFFPRQTKYLLPPEIRDSALWRSLNFVATGDIKRIAQLNNLKLEFNEGVMYQTLKRLDEDPVFAERHQGIASTYRLLEKTGLLELLRSWPVALSTPMTFTCRRHNLVAANV